jgi:predicted phosphodiesterase
LLLASLNGNDRLARQRGEALKLHILSDLHVEFGSVDPPCAAADVIILAGDTHTREKGPGWVQEAWPGKTVVYVTGNHEYYKEALPKHTQKLRGLTNGTTVHFLEQGTLLLEDVVFLGCTLWTDFALFGDPKGAASEALQGLTDYRRIRVSPTYRRLHPADTIRLHRGSIAWLESEFEKYRGQKIVVVTHHAPSRRSIPEPFEHDLLSAAYASDLDALIERSGVTLWVHGHTHASSDYRIGDTRILCNARGYPDELNPDFVPGLVVEV